MRIAGQIAHPIFKITIFQMYQKYALKIEDRFFEQTYKFKMDELPDGIESIHRLVNDKFLKNTKELFIQMMKNRQQRLEEIHRED